MRPLPTLRALLACAAMTELARRPLHALRVLLACLAMLTMFTGAHAAVPDAYAPPPSPEERQIQQTEQSRAQPGLLAPESGKQHFDRNYLGQYGDGERDVILQRGGNAWRVLRNGPMALVSGVALLVVPVLLFGFYLLIGPSKLQHPPTGRSVQRFTRWQRVVHWATAITFIVLAISGLLIMYGKNLLLPWMGHDAFYIVALVSKYLHNFVGPLFILCSVLMFATFVRKNFFNRGDWQWVKTAGGMVSKKHVPSGFFNAGEKLWFWGGVTLLGLLMSATGLYMDFVVFNQTRYGLQIASILHIAGAVAYIAASLGHIYIGTVGVQGAYQGMRSGSVDEQWAREHHSVWLDEVQGDSPPPRDPVR